MQVSLISIATFLILFTGGKARISRSAQEELAAVRWTKKIETKVNMDECWPFSDTLREIDPYIHELEEYWTETKLGRKDN